MEPNIPEFVQVCFKVSSLLCSVHSWLQHTSSVRLLGLPLYIHRLRDDIATSADRQFSDHFGIQNARILYVCKGVWKLHDVQLHRLAILASSPDFLFFQIGSNDLCKPTCQPEALTDSILRVALDLVQASGAHLAFVGQITKRTVGTYMSAEAVQAFQAARLRANNYLPTQAVKYPSVHFWKHHDLERPAIPFLDPDGVHLNPRGQFKLYKSIRGPIYFAAIH